MDKICRPGPFRMTRPACEYVYRYLRFTSWLQEYFLKWLCIGNNRLFFLLSFLFGYLNQSGIDWCIISTCSYKRGFFMKLKKYWKEKKKFSSVCSSSFDCLIISPCFLISFFFQLLLFFSLDAIFAFGQRLIDHSD